MEIVVKRMTSWERVVDAARFTVKKPPLGHEPSEKFKRAIIFSEHSPLRLLVFDVKIFGIPKYVSVHLCRHHEGVEKFVCTSRPDRNGFTKTRHEQHDDDLVDIQLSINAQSVINISRVRLCAKAELATQKVWKGVIEGIKKIEPQLFGACVKNCVYRGTCPEMDSCNFFKSSAFKTARKKYEIFFKG